MIAKTIRARRGYECDAIRDYTWFRACRGHIRAGEACVRVTMFPREEGLLLDPSDSTEWEPGDHPITAHLCTICAPGYLFEPLGTEGGQEGHS